MHSFFRKVQTGILLCLIIIPVVFFAVTFTSYGVVYETEDIEDYGRIVGNFNDIKPQEFIFSFFPEDIGSNFEDITYHYKAVKGDEYAYECYLEFVIEEEIAYNQFLVNHLDTDITQCFHYNETFMEYTVSNVFDIDWTSPNQEGGYPIGYAEIGKILYRDSDQRVIFFALGTWDGGGTDTSELDYFFEKFNIDVIEYQLSAYFSHSDQDNGIIYNDRYKLGMETPYPYPE